MRILCLNTWGGMLHERLLPFLMEVKADVYCLQEVVHTPGAAAKWLEYRDGDHVLMQRANMFREIGGALPGHIGTFCPSAQGDLLDGEANIVSQWGLATFVAENLPVAEQVQAFVHGSFSAHGFGDHPRPRNAHAVRVHDGTRDRFVSVVQLHGLRDPAGKHDTTQRAVQAQRLIAIVEAIAQPGDDLVVCGDFNLEPDSETFAHLRQLGLTDLVTTGGFAGTRTSHYKKPGRFADYLLVGPTTRPVSFDVVRDPEVSDHCPLLLEL